MENKNGLFRLGYVKNLKYNENGQNCITILSKIIGREIQLDEINEFLDSDVSALEYIDNRGNITEKNLSSELRFKLPWKDTKGNDVYGYFTRTPTGFIGVTWVSISIRNYGYINPSCWEKLKSICGIDAGESNIDKYTTWNNTGLCREYYNGAGYKKFPDGTSVTPENAKFIKFNTSIIVNNEIIVGWFTKNIRGRFEGISWGTESDFKSAQDLREQFYVGRMIFGSIDECNLFLEELKGKTIPEPWEYKHKKDDRYNYPILKSYLQFELDRLFYEQDVLKYPDRIIFNKDKSKVLFNTNLIDKFGNDLTIVGTILDISNTYIGELKISPSKKDRREMGFDPSKEPQTPEFFKDINEIVFHHGWDIDVDMERCEHIIEDRIERFPEKYRGLTPDDIGQRLRNAISLAKNIAKRNYKFIVPMYYPTKHRIQLLMPIYLETSYSSRPDFALVLTPDDGIYTPETILGLDEVYQDARLVAKPEESWLNPDMIE